MSAFVRSWLFNVETTQSHMQQHLAGHMVREFNKIQYVPRGTYTSAPSKSFKIINVCWGHGFWHNHEISHPFLFPPSTTTCLWPLQTSLNSSQFFSLSDFLYPLLANNQIKYAFIFISQGWAETVSLFEVKTQGWHFWRKGSLFTLSAKRTNYSSDHRDDVANNYWSWRWPSYLVWLDDIPGALADQSLGSRGILHWCNHLNTNSVWWVSKWFTFICKYALLIIFMLNSAI